ncbi:MAG: YeeE/YedE family protein [Actinobacteria bacterium]|nr:YeeE/YedE family protein [Actinomycetota bacterium]
MQDLLLARPPWFLAGPMLGLCVVALFAAINERLGVLGGFSDVVERLSARSLRLGWKGCFLLGLVGGAAVFTVLSGGGRLGSGYGWLTREFSGGTTAALLVASGVLVGYGAKTAGGCTSGNGLSGNAIGSRASFAATATFFGTAVAATFVTKWLFGAGV